MKTLFKWIGYLLLGLIVTTVAAVLFLVNSTQAIEWAADKYAPQYGFGYQKISGGLLSGLEIDGLTFEDDTLLERFEIGWNPASLLHKKVSVTHLNVEQLNVETIQKIIEAFSSDKPPKDDNSTFVLPVSIGLGELHLTLKPFEESGVSIEKATLEGKNLFLDDKILNIGDLALNIDTNVSRIHLAANAVDETVSIKEFSVLDIDSLALESIIKNIKEKQATGKAQEQTEEVTENGNSGEIPYLPRKISIDSVIVKLKPSARPQITIDRAELRVEQIGLLLREIMEGKPNAIEVGELSLDVDTNLSKLVMQAELSGDTVTMDSLSVREINTLALTKLFTSNDTNASKTGKEESAHSEDANGSTPLENPLIPHYLIVKHLDTSILRATYDPVVVKSAEVNASDVKFNIPKLIAESGEIDIDVASSFANLKQHGVINNNTIAGRGHITPHQLLFETYKVPLREDALSDIALDINASKEKAQVGIVIKGKEILQAEEGGFNVNTLYLNNQISYLIPENRLIVNNEGNVTTPYTKNLKLRNLLTFEKGVLHYEGEVDPGPIEGIDGNYTKPLNDLKIHYHGGISSVEALIDSEGLKGRFVSPDFKKGDFNLSTKVPLVLKNMVSLPEKLQEAKVDVNIHVPLDFASITPLKAEAKIRSNLANLDADIIYDKEIKVLTTTRFPKDSLLRNFSKELNLDALNPLMTDVALQDNRLNVNLKSKGLNSRVNYGMEDKNLTGDLVLGGAKFLFKGNLEKQVSLENSVASLQNFIKKVNTIYAFKAPPLDGDMKLSLQLKKMKDLELVLHSNKLTYKADRKTTYDLDDTMVSLGFSDSVLKLNSYHTIFQKQKIFATKPSIISLKDGIVEISPLWVNDELQVTGKYNIGEKKGEILAKADTLSVSSEMVDLKSSINIKTRLDGVKTNIDGTVTILGADVHYDMDKKSFASDSDIIIVQDMKKKGESPFMDNLSARIIVNTKKPILYKTADADIKAKADIQIQKAPRGPIYILGTAEILKGSYYAFQNKKFVFEKSIIAFTGDPSKPILDIVAIYNSVNYEITIQVTGDPSTPNIIFSSIPRLSKEEILSVILFDTEDAAGSNNGDEMMKMMGGAIAKSALSNVGIKIDHLSLGTDGSVEIGKKITDKVTIIYVNDEVAGAKLQYDYSKNIKAVISTDSESSGADIIYKREFKKLPFSD